MGLGRRVGPPDGKPTALFAQSHPGVEHPLSLCLDLAKVLFSCRRWRRSGAPTPALEPPSASKAVSQVRTHGG